MSQKVAISKPTFNVLTDAKPDDLVFSSDYNTLKYFMSGSYIMTTSTTTVVTIPHNLGYVPFHIIYCNDFNSQPTQYSLTEYFNTFGGVLRAARGYCDATNIYLSYNTGSGAPTYTIRWYYKIFKNNLGL